jgi:hypothetical protein
MSGAIHPLPQYAFMAWCLVKKHRDNFTFYLLYGCETWSLTLRKEQRLKVYENRVLRRISGPKRELQETEEEGLNNLCVPPNIIRVIKSRGRDRQHIQHAWER